MQLISMDQNAKSFRICTNLDIKRYEIMEMLFVKHGFRKFFSNKNEEYIKYKIRIATDEFGNFKTYTAYYFREKDKWYIDCSYADLMFLEKRKNQYDYM